MIGYHNASRALSLLVLLIGASFLHLSTPNQINPPENINNPHRNTLPVLLVLEDRQREDEERQSLQLEGAEEEEELFKDVDPKTLAAVLLEALNQSQVERRREGEKHAGVEKDMKAETGAIPKEEQYREGRKVEGADQERDGRRDSELLMAALGKEQEEEEEKMTEKVTSRTKSQTIQVQTEQQAPGPAGGGENEQGADPQQGPKGPEQGSNEEEEEEENLETMMKEFLRLNRDTKREGKQNQRASRSYSSYNIIPIHKGSDLALSPKKLKWQEETQKAVNFPTFKENFMDDFDDSNYAGSNVAQSQISVEQEMMENDEPEEEDEEEEEEEVLSPEEEKARAKAEQEEMRRQAAEAQRAKMKEEKLADMLLRNMVKQKNGKKKYSLSLSNAVEDKRSDEEQEVTEEDDIDPQTIDKLIEISSKLHLPADDVVDIISGAEKKKKKDVPPEITSRWQRPPSPLSSSFSSANSISAAQVSTNQNSLPFSKQPTPALSPLKTWIQETSATKYQDLLSNLAKPVEWTKLQQPLLKSARPGYPSYYERKLYPEYQTIYFPPPPRSKPRYYIPKSDLAPKGRYHSWVPPRLRNPPAGPQQKPYYTIYPLPLHPQTYQLIPKPRSPAQKQFYYSAPAPQAMRNEVYYRATKQPDGSSHDNVEKSI